MQELSVVPPALQDREWIEDLDVNPGRHDTIHRIHALEGRIKVSPSVWRLRLQVAQAYAADGDFNAAASHLRACRDLVTEPAIVAAVYFNLGVCLENTGHWSDAARAYEQCLFLLPNLFWGRVHLGRCLMRLGEWELAVHELRRALALDDQQPEVLRALGEAMHKAGIGDVSAEVDRRLADLHRRTLPFQVPALPN
jgi:tetratricopeptide (TPR) repeat protein